VSTGQRSKCLWRYYNCYIFIVFFILMKIYRCRISEEEYISAIKEEISKVVKIQEELDIDVLVHGEPEVSILVSWFVYCRLTALAFFSSMDH
jgi:hypothetical protein